MDATGNRPPRASWVMGRSARWHTSHGRALLAEDALAQRRAQELAALSTLNTGVGVDGQIDPLEAAAALTRLIRTAWRMSRRNR